MSPHDDDQLPEYSEQDERGGQGMRIVERIVGEDLRWAFRDQTRRDFGIDCLIEIVDETSRNRQAHRRADQVRRLLLP